MTPSEGALSPGRPAHGQLCYLQTPASDLWPSAEFYKNLVTASGGNVVEPPSLDDGARWLATIRDPAGNTIGVVQLGPRKSVAKVVADPRARPAEPR
jgi:predicted enzyme related to lactoylglutathione lyase